jgi:hypothetical protein
MMHQLVLWVGFLAAGLAHAAPPIPPVFESLVGRYILKETSAGAELLARVTATQADAVTEASYRSFLDRLTWRQNRVLRGEVAERLGTLESELAAPCAKSGRGAGEALNAEERALLDQAAERVLRCNRMDNLLVETTTFVEVPRPGAPDAAPAVSRTTRAARAAQGFEEAVPELPVPTTAQSQLNPTPPDLTLAKQRWWNKIADRFRSYRGFVGAFRFSEGQWRTLFTLNGKQFTARDWARIRKYNRLLDALNDYSQMRLVIKSFALERPALYARLNEATAEATGKYAEGLIAEEEYLAAREAAAKELKLNDIVVEAETRMLRAVRRVRELGGGRVGSHEQRSLIDLAEDNIAGYQAQIRRNEVSVARWKTELDAARAKLASGELEAGQRDLLNARVRELRGRINGDEADIALWKMRARNEIRELRKIYLEFVSSYDTLEMFVNLRRGRINTEQVQAFDLPDPFVPRPEEIAAWKDFYDRALYNSTHELVLKVIGVTVPTGLAATYADRLWQFIFGEDAPADEGGQADTETENEPDPGTEPSP